MLDTEPNQDQPQLTEDNLDQMIALAERLRAANGGSLDDAAIAAISEATATPSEYVRLAIKLRTEKRKSSAISNVKAQYLTLEPETRRYVVAGVATTMVALLHTADAAFIARAYNTYGILGMVALAFVTVGLYNVGLARDAKVAAVAGAILGGGFFATRAVFAAIFRLPAQIDPIMLVPFTVAGVLAGIALQAFVQKYRGQLGLKDPVKERQDLLRQLVDLQEKLRSAEQHCTFASFDIVGSTRMKELADPLSVEFTFNEYHHFVDRVTAKYGGRVHSTAGDGIICAFDHPQQGFAAARNIQAGLIELNTFRNRIGVPIVLRVGIHTGKVMTPQAGDITSVNFAHVIDIAAHLQKLAPAGAIAVSDAAAMYLPGGPSSVGTERVQAGSVAGTVWNSKPAGPLSAIATPPVPEQA